MGDKKATIPPWAGKLPFPADQKKAIKFRKEDCLTRLYGTGDHKVLTATYLSTDKLSSSSFLTPAGGYFEPYDIHGGDEVYYVAKGCGYAFNPLTGLAYPLEKGDMLWIPKGAWHQFYNFGDEISYIVTAFAPKMWTDMGTNVVFEEKPALYKTGNIDWKSLPKASGFDEDNIQSKKLGLFPAEGPKARQTQELFVIRNRDAVHVIHGRDKRMLVSLYVSNDFIHAGIMTIPSKTETDDESHKGDELIYVAEGSVSVMMKYYDHDPASVSTERFEVHEGERFFIPENVKHNYVNFNDRNTKAVFFIAPEL
jgi:mannose-6-phosphate isomerase-like protein (cupin superfamily)